MRGVPINQVIFQGKEMSYYDFDDHFWAPHEVCGQNIEIVDRKNLLFFIKKLYSWIFKQHHYKHNLKSPCVQTKRDINQTKNKSVI